VSRLGWALGTFAGITGLSMILSRKARASVVRRGRIVSLGNKALARPILYDIESEAPEWRLWCDEFGMWGQGSSLYAALSELTSKLYTSNNEPASRLAMKARWKTIMGV
jgi:hypothetical protein